MGQLRLSSPLTLPPAALPCPVLPATQDLLKLARYRIVGAVAPSPSARHSRMPTTVLAARHMRRTSSSAAHGGPHEGRLSSLEDEAPPGFAAFAGASAAHGSAGEEAPPPRLGMGLPAVAVSQQAGQRAEEVSAGWAAASPAVQALALARASLLAVMACPERRLCPLCPRLAANSPPSLPTLQNPKRSVQCVLFFGIIDFLQVPGAGLGVSRACVGAGSSPGRPAAAAHQHGQRGAGPPALVNLSWSTFP